MKLKPIIIASTIAALTTACAAGGPKLASSGQANRSPAEEGHPATRLTLFERLPAPVKKASSAVRRLCYGNADKADSCITVFAIGQGRFVANAHTLEALAVRREYCENVGHEDPDLCRSRGGFFVAGTPEEPSAVKPRILHRGKYRPRIDPRLNQARDLAILCLDTPTSSLPIPVPARPIEPAAGQSVHALGFPSTSQRALGDFDRMTRPAASSASVLNAPSERKERGIVASALLLSGMSGGPLLDDQGQLLGVARAGSLELENLLDPEAQHYELNVELYAKGALKLRNPQSSGFIPASDLRTFIQESRCKSCDSKCAKPF